MRYSVRVTSRQHRWELGERRRASGGTKTAAFIAGLTLCVACGAAGRPRYHYDYSWKGGTMRGLPIAEGRQSAATASKTSPSEAEP